MTEEEKTEKKFNVKVYQGDRVKVSVPNCLNIRRLHSWNKLLKRYGDPPRGGRYEAIRARSNGKGRETKIFEILQDARDWQNGRNFNPIEENLALTPKTGYCIEDLLNDWQRVAWPSLRETSQLAYANRIPQLRPLFGIHVESLSPKIIDEWLIVLKNPPFINSYKSTRLSLEKEFELLRAMVNWYIETNDDTKLINPFKKRHRKMVKIREKGETPPKFMTPEELERWLKVLREHSLLFWALAITQQKQILRISEAAAMKWSNLDFAAKRYRITEHVIWPRANGRPTQILPGTKTNKSGQSYYSPLREEVIAALREIEPGKKGDLIFTLDGNVLTYRQIQYAYNLAFERAGLPHRSTHTLRHTGATEFLEQVGDPLALQQMGNWTDQKMALHYGQISSSRARTAIDKAENRRNLKLVKVGNAE